MWEAQSSPASINAHQHGPLIVFDFANERVIDSIFLRLIFAHSDVLLYRRVAQLVCRCYSERDPVRDRIDFPTLLDYS